MNRSLPVITDDYLLSAGASAVPVMSADEKLRL